MIRLLSAASIFLASFLLFQIQPLIARYILPWYGGSAAVWGTCLLFFQSLLFAAYLYAHVLGRWASIRQQSIVHLLLLAASLLALPVAPSPSWKPDGDAAPIAGILELLGACVGAPYFLLSATSPLVQSWLVRLSPDALPYRFYALSNLASLIGLLAYPFFIERFWAIGTQARVWSVAYAAFAVPCGALAWRAASLAPAATGRAERTEAPSHAGASTRARWVVLAALPSALSLAVTNHLTQNVAPVPLLWVLPLSIYLVTLTLCFERDGWYRRDLFLALDGLGFLVAGFLVIRPGLQTNLPLQLSAFTVILFLLCMTLHGELVRLRPAGAELTRFYLWMAFGGALGGIGVGMGAPLFLTGYYELPIVLCGCVVALLLLSFRRHAWSDVLLGVSAAWMLVTTMAFIRSSEAGALVAVRNFYGGLRVIDRPAVGDVPAHREMVHGTIVQGAQFLDPSRRREPASYYSRGTGGSIAIQTFQRPGGRVGLIGLGVGGLAPFGKAGETLRFYELNPEVITLARERFTFLSDSAARVETVAGDGRLSLEREEPQGFSLLVLDAFSGDSIPVHLLTLEAFDLYFRHLLPDGVIAVNLGDDIVDLRPVVASAAAAFGRTAVQIRAKLDAKSLRVDSVWVLVLPPAELATRPELLRAGGVLPVDPSFAPWTDAYSNIFSVLRR